MTYRVPARQAHAPAPRKVCMASQPKERNVIVRTIGKFLAEVRDPSDAFTFLKRLVVPTDPKARQFRSWLWGSLPRVRVDEIFRGIAGAEITILNTFDRALGTSLNLEELACLLAIAKFAQAKNIIEIGTYDGNTALNLAANTSDDATITTVDLPEVWDGRLALEIPERYKNVTNRQGVGSQFSGTRYAHKIRQVFGDSAELNWGEQFHNKFDLVFIDGCHHRRYVEIDTRNALNHLRSRGLIVWHDYGYFKDVSDVVDAMAERLKVQAIAGTRLAVGILE
jgi:predicted O-methyltransferase YrrM